MFNFKHVSAVIFSGVVWLLIGCLLTFKGVNYISQGANELFLNENTHFSIIGFVLPMFDNYQKAILSLIIVSLAVGYFKGQFMLRKSVNRVVRRIITLHAPFKLKDMYTKGYVGLICGMMCLGMSMRFMPIAADVRGFIDLSIGMALLKGSFLFFKRALLLREELKA